MSIDLNKNFGRVMKTWRTGRDLSQSKVAELLEMSQAGYSKLEAGAVDTGLSNVAKAAEITGLPLGVLLGTETAKPSPDQREGVVSNLERAIEIIRAHGFIPMPKEATRERDQG